MYNWLKASFETSTPMGPLGVDGFIYRGLGIELVIDDAEDGWSEDWDVTHLASGRHLGTITGLDAAEAFKVAAMLADLADWTDARTEASEGLTALAAVASFTAV